MSHEKLLHVKFEYPEAVDSKKNLLSFQVDLLENAQTIKKYHQLRTEELKRKIKLHREIKKLLTEIRRIEKAFPKVEEPKKIQKKKKEGKIVQKKIIPDENIQEQIKKIQDKLASLETNNF